MIASVYARKSNEQNGVSDEQKSVARQVEHARAYARQKGWTVADEHIYADDGVSGAEFANRPGFMRLLNALKPRAPFDVLVVSELSRLGREQFETGYAVKQLSQAGVQIFSYLEGREVLLDSPTDKFLMSAVNFAAEIEREKARQRTYDALARKARAGHVVGGHLYGYANVEVLGPDGRRSHVDRRIEPREADVIRSIFNWCADGYGVKMIAKRLNDAGAPSPRAQRGRSQTWAPSSVRSVLHNSTYAGVIRWNATRKRNRWGQQHQTARPTTEWVEVPAPHLAIVSEEAWRAAHRRRESARAAYLAGTRGVRFGRPPIGTVSRYLLTSFAECGCCGSTLKVVTRDHGRTRGRFYACAGYHDRGRAVCDNGALIAMDDGDQIVLEAALDDVLAPDLVEDALNLALQTIVGANQGETRRRQVAAIERDIKRVEGERSRFVEAIASGEELAVLLEALKGRESRLASLRADYARVRDARPPVDADRVRHELLALADDWRRTLAGETQHARPLLSKLLVGRVAFTPRADREWLLRGQGTLVGLFERVLPANVPLGGTSPGGLSKGCMVPFVGMAA